MDDDERGTQRLFTCTTSLAITTDGKFVAYVPANANAVA